MVPPGGACVPTAQGSAGGVALAVAVRVGVARGETLTGEEDPQDASVNTVVTLMTRRWAIRTNHTDRGGRRRRQVASGRLSCLRRSLGQVLSCPRVDCVDHLLQSDPRRRELIRGTRRHVRVHGAGHQPEFLEMVEAELQRGRVAAADGAAELVESHGPIEESPDDVHRPLLLEHLDRVVDRAVVKSPHLVSRSYPLEGGSVRFLHRLTNYSTIGYDALQRLIDQPAPAGQPRTTGETGRGA